MIIETLNLAQFAANKAAKMDELREELIEVQRRAIRKAFDNTLLDSTAQACIDLAKEMGFSDMAEEMQQDFESELTVADL